MKCALVTPLGSGPSALVIWPRMGPCPPPLLFPLPGASTVRSWESAPQSRSPGPLPWSCVTAIHVTGSLGAGGSVGVWAGMGPVELRMAARRGLCSILPGQVCLLPTRCSHTPQLPSPAACLGPCPVLFSAWNSQRVGNTVCQEWASGCARLLCSSWTLAP